MTRCAVCGNATNQVARARPWLTAVVCRHPVRTGAEVAAVAADMDRAKRVVGGGSRQRTDESVDHRWLSELRLDGRFSTTRSTAPSRAAVTEPSFSGSRRASR